MRKRWDAGIKPSEITPESAFLTRRSVLQAAVVAGLRGGGWTGSGADLMTAEIGGGPMGAARVAAELLVRAFALPGE